MPSGLTSYHRTFRGSEGETEIVDLPTDLGELGSLAEDLGVAPAALFQLAGGFLVVEGQDDLGFVKRLFGSELASLRVEVLPLRGAKSVVRLAEFELITRMRIPLYVLLDNIRARYVRSGQFPDDQSSIEEKWATSAHEAWRDPLIPMQILDFPYPDIICAAPDSVLRGTLSGFGRPFDGGWSDLLSEWRRTQAPPSFKAFVMERFGLSDADRFIAGLIAGCTPANAIDSLARPAIWKILDELGVAR